MEYFPSGETFVENQYKDDLNSQYKFNGKEMDSETGYYYYGARYYNPRVSLWLNVDPLAEALPDRSPYEYTLSNPTRYTDPTGMYPDGGSGDPPSKLSGSKNLLIYIMEPNIPLSSGHMNKGSKGWDYIGVNSIDDVQGILESHYGKNNVPDFENVAIRSHGTWGGAKLNPGSSSQEYIFDASKSKGLKYISNHLSNDANLLFTGCNMTVDYLTNPETQAHVDSYTNLFLKDDRKVFFNGSSSGTRLPIMDENKNVISESFAFDSDLVRKEKVYSGFMQFNLNSKGNAIYQNRLYNMRLRSGGGFLRTDLMENKQVIKNGRQVIKK